MARPVRRMKKPLTNENIREIILACEDMRLKTIVWFLATTGCRPREALAIRIQDLNLEDNPTCVIIRGENTKTHVERYLYLTPEVAKVMKEYITWNIGQERRPHQQWIITIWFLPEKMRLNHLTRCKALMKANNEKHQMLDIVVLRENETKK